MEYYITSTGGNIQPTNQAGGYSKVRDQLVKFVKRQRSLYRKDIEKWRTAHQLAIDPYMPRRLELYETYDDVILDNHLSSVIESRYLKVENKPFRFVDSNGDVDETLTNLVRKKWAIKLNRLALEKRFYGHSLILLKPSDRPTELFSDVELIKRENVVPEKQSVIPDANSFFNFIPYTNPPESNWYIEVGDKNDLGLLLKAAPIVIFKKNSFGHWGKFQEIFSVPPRIAKTASRDTKVQNEILKWLEEMGSAGYGLFPEGTEFELMEQKNSSNGADIFDKAIQRANSELSKLVLLQTGSTDEQAYVGSAESHERKENEVTEADLSMLEYLWNDTIIPVLRNHGVVIPEDRRWEFDRSESIEFKKHWEIVDGMLKQGYKIPDEWISKNFYVPIEGRDIPGSGGGAGENFKQARGTEAARQSKALSAGMHFNINTLYNSGHQQPVNAFSFNFAISNLIQKLFEGELKSGDIDADLHRAQYNKLIAGLEEGYGINIGNVDYDTPDGELIKKLQDNVWVFSGFKNYQQLREMSNLLIDDKGKLRSYSEFENLVTSVHDQYNKLYLAAEYDHAVAGSQMAARWMEYSNNADVFPLLRYNTAGDGRVRPSHAQMNNTLLPVNHAFWNSNYPPNGWRCRCDVTQERNGRITPDQLINYPELDDMFKNNVGKSGVLYPKKHPYYKVMKKDEQKAKDNFGLGNKAPENE